MPLNLYQRFARLRFTQLEMLCTLADAGSMRPAAARLHLSAAAVSKSLRDIEASLEFALFERRPRGLAPTPRGERLIAHARLLLNELHGLAADVTWPLRGGQLTIGASPYVVARVLPQWLARLPRGQGGPALDVRIHDGHLSLLIEQLLLGQIEALVTLYATGDLADIGTEHLAIETLREEKIVVLAAPALMKAGGRKRTWRELAGKPWILPPATTYLRRSLDTMFHLDGTHPPVPHIEASHLEGNVRLAAAGLGLTIAPLELARELVEDQSLHVVSLKRALPASSLVLIYRRVSSAYLSGLQQLRAAARLAFGA
jgi:DNA-binding transcriptional LysR family regulator